MTRKNSDVADHGQRRDEPTTKPGVDLTGSTPDSDNILDYGRGFWRGNRLQSGKRIDALRDQNIPHNARVIDRTVSFNTVVSHKSTDLRRPSYRSAACVYRAGMRFVRLLAAYDGEVRCDHKKRATYYLHWAIEHDGPRILEWFIPAIDVTADQEAALARVIADAVSLGVTVQLLRIKD